MLLPLPNLDDRRWADLVEEGRSLIPLYAPEWTDHNIHDPGITLIELFAWISEMDVFQLNQIPERHRRKFLSLLGIQPTPPRAAKTILRFGLLPRSAPLLLPASLDFEGSDPFGRLVHARTLEGLTIASTELAAIQIADQQGTRDLTARWRRGEPFSLFGDDAQPCAALYLGFTEAFPPGSPVTLFFMCSDLAAAGEERARLAREVEACRARCRAPASLVTCAEAPDTAHDSGAPGAQSLPHHSVRTVWELLVGPNRWQTLLPELNQVTDETRAFTLDGRVIITAPAPMVAARLGGVDSALYYLRCRFVAGAYDAAPTLINLVVNGAQAEQAVDVGELMWTIVPGGKVTGTATPGDLVSIRVQLDAQGQIAELAFGGADAPLFRILTFQPPLADAPGSLRLEAEWLGSGTGDSFQQVTLSQRPVQESSVRVYTLEQGQWRVWTIRSDFDASTRDDRHTILDPTSGTLTFGDGDKGMAPPFDARIVARYRATRAAAGNVAAATFRSLSDNAHNLALLHGLDPAAQASEFDAVKARLATITNPIGATGGAAAETLEQAEGRAVDLVEKAQRAVTLDDYVALAKETPGTRIDRAMARANVHPDLLCLQASGVVTIVVLPHLPLGRPAPSAGLLRAVAAYLNRRRIIGTRLEVVGPTYLEISVQATVQASQGLSKAPVQRAAMQALRDFFDPSHGGPDATGWPFGRDVFRYEVLQALGETPGVEHVLSLELVAGSGDTRCSDICVGPFGLVALVQQQIQVV